MIKLTNISKSYGKKTVLKNVSYHFDRTNVIYTLLGESGVGKTTLLNILYGIDQDYQGEYELNNKLAKHFSSYDWDNIRNKEVGFVFQDFKLLEDLTVFENLDYTYFLEPDKKNERIYKVLETINLKEQSHQKVRDLSGGQKQRLAIGRAILNNPNIILLDEPTGSLDDSNTHKIIQYIQKIKENKTVIIITHDKRLIDYSDVTLQLENQTLKVIKDDTINPRKLQKASNNEYRKYFKPRIGSYFLHSIKPRIKELIVNNVPVTLIMCVFICIYALINLSFNQQIDNLYQGLSDDSIYISTANFSEDYLNYLNKHKINKSDDGTRINFSEKDLDNVEDIPYVESARLYNGSNVSLYDKEEYRLNLIWEKEEFPNQLKEVSSYSSAPSIVQFSFNSMNIPHDYASSFNQINLLYGDYPKDGSDEIVIPDFLASSHFSESKEAINEKIKFNVYDENNKTKTKEYTIVGVYDSEYEQHISDNYPIYVTYLEYDFLDLFLTEDQYKELKNVDIGNNRLVDNYHNPIYDSYESYKKAIGTNLGNMIIIVDSPKHVQNVHESLEELFPNLKIISQYEFEHGETSIAFQKIKTTIYLGITAFVLLLSIIIIFLNKSYIRTRSKEFAILYSMGYSRKHIAKLILIENIMNFAIDLGLAYLILKIIQISGFKAEDTYEMFGQIFATEQILQILSFILIMLLVSVFFSLYSINKKKLRKYLEGDK